MRRALGAVVALTLASGVSGLTLRSDARAPEADSAAEFAGTYWLSPPNFTGSWRLVISADSRFRMTSTGCFGTSEIGRGFVAYHDGLLFLKPGSRHTIQFPIEWKTMVPARHEGSLYLVTSDRAGAFLNAMYADRLHCSECESFFMREDGMEFTGSRVVPFSSRQTVPETR